MSTYEAKISTGQSQAEVTKGHENKKFNIIHATHVFGTVLDVGIIGWSYHQDSLRPFGASNGRGQSQS